MILSFVPSRTRGASLGNTSSRACPGTSCLVPRRPQLSPRLGHFLWAASLFLKRLLFYDRCSSAANPVNFIFGRDAYAVIVRYGERREHRPVADFKLLKDVMDVLFDGTVSKIQPAPNFLFRQPFGDQARDLALPVCQHRQHLLRVRDVPLLPR